MKTNRRGFPRVEQSTRYCVGRGPVPVGDDPNKMMMTVFDEYRVDFRCPCGADWFEYFEPGEHRLVMCPYHNWKSHHEHGCEGRYHTEPVHGELNW